MNKKLNQNLKNINESIFISFIIYLKYEWDQTIHIIEIITAKSHFLLISCFSLRLNHDKKYIAITQMKNQIILYIDKLSHKKCVQTYSIKKLAVILIEINANEVSRFFNAVNNHIGAIKLKKPIINAEFNNLVFIMWLEKI